MNILGYNYTVTADIDEDTMGAYGRFHSKDLRLQIASDLCIQQKKSAVLHEVLEALNYHLGMGLEHKIIDNLEAGLYQVLTENGVDLVPLAKDVLK
jgi:predicted nucleotide-binding protein (sugar kinase/HSP70/actin superfamily)